MTQHPGQLCTVVSVALSPPMHSEPVLEFEPLRALLARYVRSSLGRAELAQVEPISDRGEIESVFRVTPRAVAARVIVKPKGSMHWRKTTPPGCGGFFIIIGRSPCLVVIDIINILRATVKAKNHSPVCPNGHPPKDPSVGL